MKPEEIFNEIVFSFSSLWKMRMRGSTIEIITPYATTTNKFISLFICKRGKEYVVSDGGWIEAGIYELTPPRHDEVFMRLLNFCLEEYDIQTTVARDTIFYFKKTEDVRLIPNLIFDIAGFAHMAINGSAVSFQEIRELTHQQRFTYEATEYYRSLYPPENLIVNKPITESMSKVRFNLIIKEGNDFKVINMVTGSTDSYFINSLGRSSLKFSMLENHQINRYVSQKITLINSSMASAKSESVRPYLELIKQTAGQSLLAWNGQSSPVEYALG